MIDQKLARNLIPLVNSEEYSYLQEYVKSRIESIKDQLTISSNLIQINKLQGAFDELNKLSKLREYVDQDKK